MRKKLMSCFVALMFTMSIGANVMYAVESTSMSNSNSDSGLMFLQSVGTKAVTKDDAGKDLLSSVTSFYTWVGGNLTTITGSDRKITLMKGGQAFITLGYSHESGEYTVVSANLSGSDWDKISAMPGADDAEKLKNYLMSLGVPESALQVKTEVYKKDDDGKLIPALSVSAAASAWDKDSDDYEEYFYADGTKINSLDEYKNRPNVDVAWLNKAVETLKGGINKTVAIDFTGTTGATMTTIENGRAIESYSGSTVNGQLYKTAQYYYTSSGFLNTVESYSMSTYYTNQAFNDYLDKLQEVQMNNPGDPDAVEKYKKDNPFEGDPGKVGVKEEISITHYNKFGQAAYVETTDKDRKNFNLTVTYNYNKNGGIATQIDHKNNIKYVFDNNKMFQVLNKENYILSQYDYFTDGSIKGITSFNDGNPVTRTFYLFGRELGTVHNSGGPISYDEARKIYMQATAPGKTTEEIRELFDKGQFTSVQIYKGHLNNTNLMNFLLNPGGTRSAAQVAVDMNAMLANTNNYSSVGTASLNYSKGLTKNETRDGRVTYTIDGKEMSESEAKKWMWDRTTSSQKSQLKDKDGNVASKWEDIDIEKSGNTNIGSHSITKKTYTETSTTTYDKVTVNFSINNRGGQDYTVDNSCEYNVVPGEWKETGGGDTVNLGGYSDPAVVGVIDSFVDADGNVIGNVEQYLLENPGAKVYAKVSASGINMMDGSGFQAVDGEEIFVEITADMAKELSIGKEAMFMGDVSKSSDGQYVMRTNDNYNVTVNGTNYKGFVTGADLAAAKAEVQDESIKALNGDSKYGWMNVNTNINRGLFGLGAGSYLNDWKAGWAILAGWND